MSVFQAVVAPLLFILFVRSSSRLSSGRHSRRSALIEGAIWLSATVAVVRPDISMQLANSIGIGRGADLLLYLFVLTVLLGALHFHQRLQRLESEISEAVRRLAIREALARWPDEYEVSGPYDESGLEQIHFVSQNRSNPEGSQR